LQIRRLPFLANSAPATCDNFANASPKSLTDGSETGARSRRSIAMLYFPHMAAKKMTLNELGDMLAHVVKYMATKDDLAALETRLDRRIDKLDTKIDSVESNLAAKINRLDTKLTKFEENEIDKRLQLEVRVASIEKHLGSNKKIAA
jgi:flagellar capping protein FliD